MFDFPEDYCAVGICVVCEAQLAEQPVRNAGNYVAHCPCCGPYKISGSAYITLARSWKTDLEKRQFLPLLSHHVRQRQRSSAIPFLRTPWLTDFIESNPEYPGAIDQLENLAIYLAETLKVGECRTLSMDTCRSIVGSFSEKAADWVVESALERQWIKGSPFRSSGGMVKIIDCRLTLQGWEWYNDIGRHRRSRRAFMAMPYGQPDLAAIVKDHFTPAVAETGFQLVRLDDEPKAGVIDNRLRVDIRRSRLLIADITHDNHGAIWEAGFAEGLGLPVIYTCEKSKINGKHFDIRNCQIVAWENGNLDSAVEMLKATIRNTLPDEAVLD